MKEIDWKELYGCNPRAIVSFRDLEAFYLQLMEILGEHTHFFIDSSLQTCASGKMEFDPGPEPLCDCEERKVLEKYKFVKPIPYWCRVTTEGWSAMVTCPACKRKLPG